MWQMPPSKAEHLPLPVCLDLRWWSAHWPDCMTYLISCAWMCVCGMALWLYAWIKPMEQLCELSWRRAVHVKLSPRRPRGLFTLTVVMMVCALSRLSAPAYKLHGIFHRMLLELCDAVSQKWCWERNRAMLTFHLLSWEYLIWWSKMYSILQMKTMTLSPRCLYLKGLCKKKKNFISAEQRQRLTWLLPPFSSQAQCCFIKCEKKIETAFNYPRLSSLSKSTLIC